MKRTMMKTLAVGLLMAATTQGMQAQGLLKGLKSIAKEGVTESVKEAVDSATGTNATLSKHAVTRDSLLGKWTYTEPCVAFESKNALTKLAGNMASEKAEKELGAALSKIDFTGGKVTLTLNADSTGVLTLGEKDVQVNWNVKESDLVLVFPLTEKEVSMNASMAGSELQLAMNPEKMKTLLTAATEKAEAVGTALTAVTSALKNVEGVYLGMKYKK